MALSPHPFILFISNFSNLASLVHQTEIQTNAHSQSLDCRRKAEWKGNHTDTVRGQHPKSARKDQVDILNMADHSAEALSLSKLKCCNLLSLLRFVRLNIMKFISVKTLKKFPPQMIHLWTSDYPCDPQLRSETFLVKSALNWINVC